MNQSNDLTPTQLNGTYELDLNERVVMTKAELLEVLEMFKINLQMNQRKSKL